jgi:hypothetical protein
VMPWWIWLLVGLGLLGVAFLVGLYAIGLAAAVDHRWEEPRKRKEDRGSV